MLPAIKTPDQALELLLNSFAMQDRGDPAMAVAAYAIAIEGIDAPAVVEAAKRFVRGEVEGHDGRFMPTPPQLAKEARTCASHQKWLVEREAHRLAIEARRASPPPPQAEPAPTVLSAEERERRHEQFKSLSAELTARAAARMTQH
jgi:hypothetical protein